MSSPDPSRDRYPQVHWLPAIDWNVKFFGAHEQHVSPDWSVPQESHIGFEIVLILEGCQETVMEENRYLLYPGDMMLILPGFKHVNRCVSKEGMRYFCAHFNVDDPAFRQEMMKHDRIVFPAGSDDNGKMRNVLDEWMAMLRRRGGYSTADRFRMQAHLFELFGILAQMVSSIAEKGGEKPLAPTSMQYAKAIAEAMKANFNPHLPNEEQSGEQMFRIDDIASSLGISPGYGQEVFRKVYGISPRRYLSELKLQEAKVMIRQPELTLKEIASRLGYSQLSHFSRQFKRWTGMSPLRYRQSRNDETPR